MLNKITILLFYQLVKILHGAHINILMLLLYIKYVINLINSNAYDTEKWVFILLPLFLLSCFLYNLSSFFLPYFLPACFLSFSFLPWFYIYFCSPCYFALFTPYPFCLWLLLFLFLYLWFDLEQLYKNNLVIFKASLIN